MKDKKVVALIILSILAVISLTYGIITPAKGRKRRPAPKPKAVRTRDHEAASTEKGTIPTKRWAKKTEFTEWGRNPFFPHGSGGGHSSLQGIIWQEGTPKAMINNEIVKKGDKVDGKTVVEITKNTVTLDDGSKKTVLRLGE